MLNQLEKKILKIVADSQLLTKPELIKMLNGSGGGSVSTVESAARNLVNKKLLTSISPIGSTCYVITQKGIKLLQDDF